MAVVHNLLPRIIKSGLGVLQPVHGITALLRVVTSAAPGPQLVVSPFDWHKLMAGAQGSVYPVFKEFEGWASLPARLSQGRALEAKPAAVNPATQ